MNCPDEKSYVCSNVFPINGKQSILCRIIISILDLMTLTSSKYEMLYRSLNLAKFQRASKTGYNMLAITSVVMCTFYLVMSCEYSQEDLAQSVRYSDQHIHSSRSNFTSVIFKGACFLMN